MKGHVLHLSWLHGVVPGVCAIFGCTNMSQIFVSCLCFAVLYPVFYYFEFVFYIFIVIV